MFATTQMNKVGIAIIVLLVGYASSLEILSLDCDGRFNLLPSYPIPLQFDLSSVLGVADTFISLHKDRLKCLCSDLTDEEYNRLLHPFFGADMAFNIIQGPDADLSFSRCKWSDFNRTYISANNMNFYKFNLTDTCSYDTWMKDNKCMAQSKTFSDWDVTIKGAVFRCPNASWRPSFTVICEGKGCTQAFIPCLSNNDCAGDMTCQKLILDGVERPSENDIISSFRTMLLAEDTPESCINPTDFIMKTVDLIRKIMKKDSADYTLPYLQFCSPLNLNIESKNSSFIWDELLHLSNTSLDFENRSVAFPGYIQPWSGELMSGGTVVPPKVVINTKPSTDTITPGAILLAEKTCDGRFNLVPTLGLGFQLNYLWTPQVLNQWVSTVLPILRCRFHSMGLSISDQELITRWGLGLDNMFFTTDSETRDDPITRDDIRDFRIKFDTRLEYPSSCNYDSWVNSGSCYASYTGFSNLLGVDVTINFAILKCPGSQDIKATFECVGEACSLFTLKSTPCNTDADCPSSLSCKDIGSQFGDFDLIGSYTGTNKFNIKNQCAPTTDQVQSDARKLILSFWNLPYDGSSDNKYCIIDYDHVKAQMSTWAKGEVETTSPGVVRLKNLKSMNEEGKNLATSISSELTVLLLIVGLLNLFL